jgi:exonuclease VII large subunit
MKTWFQQFRMLTKVLGATTLITVETHVDQEAIARQLKIDERARTEGRDNRPASTAQGPDAHEQTIVGHFRELWRQTQAWYRDALKRAQAQQEQAAEQLATERLEACYDAAQRDLATQEVALREPLLAVRQREQQALRDWKVFRNAHGLAREASYPDSRLWHSAALVGLVVVEALANCYFFAREGTGGLIAGFLLGLVVAGVHVAMAFGAGMVLRGLHSPGARRLLAAAAGVGYVGMLGLYLLAVGHYRIALGNPMPERAAVVAFARLTQAPLALEDLHTLLLMLVAGLFAIAAVIAGYTADDPIIGYGAVTRSYKAATAAYATLKEHYLLGIREAIDTQLSTVDARFGEAKAALTMYRASVAEATRLGRSYERTCAALVDACSASVQRYRTENEKVRTTASPAYFADAPRRPFEPDEVFDPELAAVAAGQHATDLAQRLIDLQATADRVKHQLHELYTTSLERVPAYFVQLEALVDGLTPLQHTSSKRTGEDGAFTRNQEVSNGVPYVEARSGAL